jgi:hypothetical protein
VDNETGEVYEEDAAPFEPAAPDLASDPDVLAALDAAGMSQAKRTALLSSAQTDGWTKEHLIQIINKHNAPRPAAATAGKPVAAATAGNNGKRERLF